MDGFLRFLEVLGILAAVLVAAAAALIVLLRRLPESPLKHDLRAFSRRVSATAVVTLIGLPLQPIPEVDGLYDIVGLIALALYWHGMIREIRTAGTWKEAKAPILRAMPGMMRMIRLLKRLRRSC